MMKKLENCMKQNEWKMEDLQESIAKNRKSLIDELRTLAGRLEEDKTRKVYESDVSWINTYVKRIGEAEEAIKALHEQQMVLKYIAEKE